MDRPPAFGLTAPSAVTGRPARHQASAQLIQSAAARRRRGLADLHAADLDRKAAVGRSLVGGQRRVALHDRDAVERHIEFLGCHLGQRRADTRAEVDLAGKHRDAAVGINRKKAVDLVERYRLSSGRAVLREGGPAACEREADDERARP